MNKLRRIRIVISTKIYYICTSFEVLYLLNGNISIYDIWNLDIIITINIRISSNYDRNKRSPYVVMIEKLT